MAKAKQNSALNEKQISFCERYAIHHNGALAAREAGYSANSARQQAFDLLTKPDVKAYVRILEDEAAYNCKITKEMVVKHLAEVGFSSGKGMTKIMALKYLGDALGTFDRDKSGGETGASVGDDIAGIHEALRKAEKRE